MPKLEVRPAMRAWVARSHDAPSRRRWRNIMAGEQLDVSLEDVDLLV
jgi:hypothetical protein